MEKYAPGTNQDAAIATGEGASIEIHQGRDIEERRDGASSPRRFP